MQGYEQQVLEGATGILPQVKGIQLEMSLVPLYQGELLFREMLDYMNNLGYSLHWLKPTITDPNTGQMLQLDGIFFKLWMYYSFLEYLQLNFPISKTTPQREWLILWWEKDNFSV